MFMGAINAYTGEVPEGQNVLTGDTGCPSRPLRGTTNPKGSSGSSLVTTNYGEGSSREHAALSPRLLVVQPSSPGVLRVSTSPT